MSSDKFTVQRNRILIVEDHEDVQILLQRALAGIAGELVIASTAQQARDQLKNFDCFCMILLDITLPDTDGLQLFNEIQANPETSAIPVVFLTGKKDVAHKVAAFAMGADDYIEKPFNVIELRARLESKIRKLYKLRDDGNQLIRGPVSLDASTQRVLVGTKDGGTRAVHFTPREFNLLFFMAKNEDRVVSRQQILDTLWGNESEIIDRVVDSHIFAIRRKLGEYGQFIEAVPGQGYRFTTKPSRAGDAA